MELVEIHLKDTDRIAPLVAAFRTQLKSYKGISAQPDLEAGKEEIIEFLTSGFPVFAVEDDGALDSRLHGRRYRLQLCPSE